MTGPLTGPKSALRSRRAVLLAGTGILVVLAMAGFAVVRTLADQVRPTWIEDVTVSADGQVLAVTFLAGVTPECGDPGGVRVDEDETSVRLTAEVVYRDVPLSGKFCPAAGKIATRDVRLVEPLGDRAVIDTSREGTEEPVQVVRS